MSIVRSTPKKNHDTRRRNNALVDEALTRVNTHPRLFLSSSQTPPPMISSLVGSEMCIRDRADYDFFGHQLVIHVDPNHEGKAHHNEVDGKSVPIPHFGVVIPWDDFDKFANMLNTNNIHFVIEPYIRFEGLPGEQKTMFFYDNSGNALEFKSFKDMDMLFSTKI